jgi:hypothetical protein
MTPDWTDPASYGDVSRWTIARWRWEFIRRRDDVCRAFDETAKAEHEHWSRFAGIEGFPIAHLTPDHPGFTVAHPLAEQIGLARIPNPRIGDQPRSAIVWQNAPDVLTGFRREVPPDGFHRIDFDLSKPIEPQLEAAKLTLRDAQVRHMGKPVQRRRHPAKWLGYLRILDGRAAGASWAQLADALPYTRGSEQAARDTWQQADALRFNF